MRIALAQITSGRDLARNLSTVTDQIAAAAALGAQLVVFPEATMRAFGHRLTDCAQPLDGPWLTAIDEAARSTGTCAVVGTFTPGTPRADGGARVRNTLAVVGQVRAHYDKIHLFDALGFAESDTVDAGDELTTVEIGGVCCGLTVCYDLRFPDQFQELARRGAQAIIVIASWQDGDGKLAQWQILNRARALDCVSWILACDQAPPKEPTSAPTGVGHSLVVAPNGSIVAELGDEPDLLLWDLDISGVADARAKLPILQR